MIEDWQEIIIDQYYLLVSIDPLFLNLCAFFILICKRSAYTPHSQI